MKKEKVDVLVIGAGPSGTVAASIVNKYGFKTKIIEKDKFPRFVIGESLLPRSMEHFEEAGFLEALNTQGYEKKLGAKFVRNNQECLFDFSKVYTKGWTWTWQVPRSDFDQILANEVNKKGISIEWETSVIEVYFSGSDSVTIVENKNGVKWEIEASFIIDSSGYGRVLPRLLKLEEFSTLTLRNAMFTHCLDSKKPKGLEGTQITFIVHKQDVWLWVIPFSNGITSLGVVGNPEYISSFKGTDDTRFRAMIEDTPQIKERFKNNEFIFKPITISGYSKAVKKLYGSGYALTGNSAEFLDPVFSSGVCFATESGALSAKLACKQLSGNYVDWEKEYSDHMKHGVNVFRSYVTAWYDGSLQTVFFAKNENKKIKEQICSVLAGYVWDKSNPFVLKHDKAIKVLSDVIKLEENTKI